MVLVQVLVLAEDSIEEEVFHQAVALVAVTQAAEEPVGRIN